MNFQELTAKIEELEAERQQIIERHGLINGRLHQAEGRRQTIHGEIDALSVKLPRLLASEALGDIPAGSAARIRSEIKGLRREAEGLPLLLKGLERELIIAGRERQLMDGRLKPMQAYARARKKVTGGATGRDAIDALRDAAKPLGKDISDDVRAVVAEAQAAS